MKTNKWLLLILIASFALGICAQNSTQPSQWLMPKPKTLTDNGVTFDLNRSVTLTDPTNSTLLASLFTVSGSGSATVTVNIVDAATLGTFDYELAGFDNEGYKLNVTADAITITAATKTGVIRAAQTLQQLAAATDGASIQGVDITDYPAFKLRGFMHDVGRSFISFNELKKEIDLLSRFKINVFHWHLTDNQGFRFESEKYPQLNQAANMTRFAGSYYTQQQCTELEAYAAERGVIVIPEIDMPGHSAAFTNTMGFTMSSTEGRAVLKQLLSELAAAFPLAPYIHMGADEAGTTAEFVNEMSQYIKETLGRKCIVWNPISGVTINTTNLPYIDMTEMWSTSGTKITGLPNIDCRYNYINHFDVFADLVGIYKSNVYYAQQGSSEVAGAITAIWNDRKTATEGDIISQNGLYANALATAERGWMGGGNQYIEVGGTTLPNSGSEFEEFADWERRFLHYKDTWLSAEPIPYVKQTNVKWRITQAFPNGGTASTVFPPETATDDILPDQFTYEGQTYSTSMATGAGIYLRHVWGTTVPGFYANPVLNTTAYAWTYVYSPTAQTAGALIEFHNYSRSENDKAPETGNWDRKGSRIWVNGVEVMPPTWTNTGVAINSEVDLGNENFPARSPISISLNAGWNKVLLKLPYVNASNIRLNKWMFTFVLTDATGRHALDNITYSPIQSLDANVEGVVAKIGEIKTYINSVCKTQVGYYPPSAAATLNEKIAQVEATLQTTMTAVQREAQVTELQTAFETFQSSLSSQTINQPVASTESESHYYTLCTPLRGSRYVTSTGAGGELGGGTTVTAASCWKFVSRGDGTFNIVNAFDNSYILPNNTNNSALSTQAAVPSAGWTISKADETGYVIITSGSCQFNQTNFGDYQVYNWGSGTDTSDTGCKYVITEIEENDIPLPLSTEPLDELNDKDVNIGTNAVATVETGKWYIMKNMGRNGYLYENSSSHTLYITETASSGSATNKAKFLVRIVSENNKYYLQTGFGNYFGEILQSTNVPTTATKEQPISFGKIANTDGHYYLASSAGCVLDANGFSKGDGTVVGWGTTVPTATGGNNDWAFYPVTLTDSSDPTISEVYTINNTNSGRGAMMYAPSQSQTYVWSSGKNSQTFSATDPNCQWVFVPSGTDQQYYLYNVGAQKFAVPTTGGTFNGYCWKFSNDAVAVTLIEQNDGTFKIKTATTDTYAAVSNGYNGPIINYNDVGGNFTITKVEGDESTAATAALNKLMKNQTALTAVPTGEGWYAIRVKSGTYANEFVYAPEDEIAYATGRNYPLTFMNNVNMQPAINNTAYLTNIKKTDNGYAWQLPNGLYLYKNTSNYFPTSTAEVVENVSVTYSTNGMQFIHGGYKAAPYYLSSKCFIGETSGTGGYFDVYPVNLTDAGLVAWQMLCDNAPETAQIACTRTDVSGLTSVYKNGYFFLPSDVTPTSSDFSLPGATNPVVNTTAKTVTFTYDPNLAIVAEGITVSQGWQTAGRDSEVMLLKVNAAPFKDANDVTMTVSLKDGAEANISKLTLYEANSDSPEIYSTGNGAPTKTKVSETNVTSATATFNIGSFTAGTHYYWIGATVKSDATLGAVIDAAVTGLSYQVTGQTAQTLDLTSVGNPADRGAMVFNTHSYPFLPWDNGSRVYRIPAMVVANDGSIIVACDKRYDSFRDIGGGHVIDIVVRRSTDGGKTWSDPVIIAKGDNTNDATCGYGDPSLIKGKDGKIYCFFAAGNIGYFYGLNRICMSVSTDNGATWSSSAENPPADLVSTGKVADHATSYGSNTCYGLYDYFITSGRGLCTSEGYLMGLLPAQAYTNQGKTEHTGNSQDYIFYSTDKGATWHISEQAIFAGGDEAKVIQANDGSLIASVRQGYSRGFNTATYTKNNDGTLTFTMGTQWNNSQLNAGGAANNQDIFYYQRETVTGKTDVIFHSMTTGNHANLKLYYSTDGGSNWTEFLNVQTKGARYVTLDKSGTDENPGSLYVFYEDQSLNAAGGATDYNHYPLNFLEITREQLEALIPALNDYTVKVADEVKVVYGMTAHTTYGTLNGLTWTSNASSGVASLTMVASDGAFDQFGNWNSHYNIAYHPATANTDATLTLTAPAGYLIESYSMLVSRASSASHTYTVTNAAGTSVNVPFASNASSYATVSQSNINAASTVITVNTTDASRWLAIADFTVTLAKQFPLNVVGDASYATLYLPIDVTTNGATKAYYITTTNNGYARLTPTGSEGTEIPANTAVVLVNSEAATSTTFTTTSGLSSVVEADANLLKGTFKEMSLDLSEDTPYYSLGRYNGEIGFYKFENNGNHIITLGANKAYLSVPASAGVRGFTFSFNETEGIRTMEVRKADDATIYTLSGQRVIHPARGIYIVGGKKVLFK